MKIFLRKTTPKKNTHNIRAYSVRIFLTIFSELTIFHQLADGILQFEDKRKSIPQADFTDLQTFLSAYLNTPEPKKRKKLAEEFRKRHMELYEFLQSNPELIRAETKITATLQAAASGAAEEDDNGQITNLFEKLQEGLA